MIKLISIYLTVLGIVQLLSVNLGGIFTLFWAKGIARTKPSSRYWVLSIHSIYLALCMAGIAISLFRPDNENFLTVFGDKVCVGRMIVILFLLFSAVIYGLPVLWLMRKDIKDKFIEQSVPGYPPQGVGSPDP